MNSRAVIIAGKEKNDYYIVYREFSTIFCFVPGQMALLLLLGSSPVPYLSNSSFSTLYLNWAWNWWQHFRFRINTLEPFWTHDHLVKPGRSSLSWNPRTHLGYISNLLTWATFRKICIERSITSVFLKNWNRKAPFGGNAVMDAAFITVIFLGLYHIIGSKVCCYLESLGTGSNTCAACDYEAY